jgi:hypothetical protein
MEKDEAIKIAKSKKSSADQLKGLLGISDEIDLLLAKHLNTSAEMLDDICWRQSFDDKIARLHLFIQISMLDSSSMWELTILLQPIKIQNSRS